MPESDGYSLSIWFVSQVYAIWQPQLQPFGSLKPLAFFVFNLASFKAPARCAQCDVAPSGSSDRERVLAAMEASWQQCLSS
jgi:hypothetical protein